MVCFLEIVIRWHLDNQRSPPASHGDGLITLEWWRVNALLMTTCALWDVDDYYRTPLICQVVREAVHHLVVFVLVHDSQDRGIQVRVGYSCLGIRKKWT